MLRLTKLLIHAILLGSVTTVVASEMPEPHEGSTPSMDQIIDGMRQHEALQSKVLKHYDAIRHYQVQYKGFATTLTASMNVEVNYDSASGKSFHILSQSGSKLLCDKVLKRAVESEKEASLDKQSTALTPANYRFRFTGTERLDGQTAYVLHVDPLRPGKFLYRGSVWVDSPAYAVDKIEVEPAKNPSFWISSTEIESTNSQIQGIWLPKTNRSQSKIRIGGTAVLTIDYGTYHVVLAGQPQDQMNGHPAIGSAPTGAASLR